MKIKIIAMFISAVLFSLVSIVSAQPAESLPGSVTIKNCLTAMDEEAEVAAQEAGVLVEIPMKEGQQVNAGELLARIDDSLPQMELRVATNKLKVAQEEAKNDVNVRYTTAASEVADAEYRKNLQANEKSPGAVTEVRLEELKLKHKETLLGIQKAKMDLRIAALQCKVSEAELDAAKEKVERRQVKSPLDGQVRKIYHHVGEWVQPDDPEPIIHVVRVNRLRTEGFLNAAEFAPTEVSGKPVTIKVQLARGRVETFEGTIVFVDPFVQAGGKYLVRAAIQNREENGQWLLRSGMNAEMTIQLK